MKNKAWIKYGFIFLVIDVILIIFAMSTSSPSEADVLAVSFVQIPFSFLVDNLNIYKTVIVGLVGWFVTGSLIGLMVQKSKSKSK